MWHEVKFKLESMNGYNKMTFSPNIKSNQIVQKAYSAACVSSSRHSISTHLYLNLLSAFAVLRTHFSKPYKPRILTNGTTYSHSVLFVLLILYTRIMFVAWGTRWRSWLRHCATSRNVAGSIPEGVIGILH